MSETTLSHLRSVGFFRELAPNTLDIVAARMIPRRYPKGRLLFREGEPCRGLFILTRGKVEIYRSRSDGREHVLHVELPVQSVAELPLFDGGPYPASGRAAEDSDLLFLSLDDFRRLYLEHPAIAHAVIQNLGRRLRHLVQTLQRVSLLGVPARVASLLLELAKNSGALRNDGTFFLPYTQGQMAQLLATTRESVARALSDLRGKGLIRQEGRKVLIVDLLGLEKVVEGED